jgi:hypothetical protein
MEAHMALNEIAAQRPSITLDMIAGKISDLIDHSGTNARLSAMLVEEVAGPVPTDGESDTAEPPRAKLDHIWHMLGYLSDNLDRDRNSLRRLENVLSSNVAKTASGG